MKLKETNQTKWTRRDRIDFKWWRMRQSRRDSFSFEFLSRLSIVGMIARDKLGDDWSLILEVSHLISPIRVSRLIELYISNLITRFIQFQVH